MTHEIEGQVRRRTRRVVLGAIVVLAIVAAVYAVVGGWGAGDDSAHPPAPPATAPAGGGAPGESAPPAPSGAASASSSDGSDLGPVTWLDVRGMTLPVSDRAGPRQRGGGRASGFTHDRAGAVLAAAHISVRADAIVGPAVFEATIHDQVVGVDAAALAAAVRADYTTRAAQTGVTGGQPLPNTHAEMTGYVIDSYTDASVFLRLLLATPGPQAQGTLYVSFRLEVRWSLGGDWQLVAPPGGQWRNATGQVPTPDGYILFPTRR